jgi:soluble lytic murein transglycosylase-like protein
MFQLSLIVLLLSAALLPVRAVAIEPTSACAEAGAAAERNWTLPADLLPAIGRVESGRFDRAAGRTAAWPWTVNANGSGFWFASRTEAVAFVRELQVLGVRLIDVGCFQIDLFYHPAAFNSLEQAFDPDANADYAARFLTTLHGRSGSWPAAIASYHSSLPAEGENYRQKVMAHWGGSGDVAAAAAIMPNTAGTGSLRPNQDPYVVLMSAAARAIPVFYGR